jgi:DNA (cytosine-5)-methyltransferase 1
VRVLDLFSGIGGFSLGLERAGMTTAAFCEIDPFCRRVLAKHWPETPIYDDVRTLNADRLDADGITDIDVICGGFPCQPISSASRGRRLATRDDRWLWPEMCRLVAEVRPAWVVGENVLDLQRLALGQVHADLEGLGYEVRSFDIPACAVNLDHIRPRTWVVGYANREGEPSRAFDVEVARLSRNRRDARGVGASDGVSGRLDSRRLKVAGNAVVPAIVEQFGRAIAAAEIANV